MSSLDYYRLFTFCNAQKVDSLSNQTSKGCLASSDQLVTAKKKKKETPNN